MSLELTPDDVERLLSATPAELIADLMGGDQGEAAKPAEQLTEAEMDFASRALAELLPEGPAGLVEGLGLPKAIEPMIEAGILSRMGPIVVSMREPENRTEVGRRLVQALALVGREWGWSADLVAEAVRAAW